MRGDRSGPRTSNTYERAAQLVKVAELYVHGRPQYEIAEKLQITQQQVSYDLKKIQRQWLDQATAMVSEHRAAELARIDERERVAWEAWHRSTQEQQITVTERIEGDGGRKDRASVKTVQKVGAVEFLNAIQACSDQRCKILGLYAVDQAALQETTIRLIGVLMDDV